MKNLIKIKLIFTVLFLCFFGQHTDAQYKEYKFTRTVETNNSLWNEILLPIEIFDHLRNDYSDIRLYTIAEEDTLEEPYLLEIIESKTKVKRISFELLNQVKDYQSYYYTYSLDSIQNVNEIDLNFGVKNFDTRVTLHGSNDNKKWFLIKENQRVLSIRNQEVNYAYSKLKFPQIRYKYLKIEVKGLQNLKLQSSSITYNVTSKVGLNSCETEIFNIDNDIKNKRTIINWTTKNLAPISTIQLEVMDKVDYVRNLRCYYATDSTSTNEGMKYKYRQLFQGTISSFESSYYSFSPTILKRLKIEILNEDNQPLNIENFTVKANSVRLKTRISNQGRHQLLYGNKDAQFPKYDIRKFQNKIPKTLEKASLGKETLNPANLTDQIPVVKPVFENKLWLWGLMGLIIVLLGWFTFKMMK